MRPRGRPVIFIVGAPKSGTTALYEYLGQHPQVFIPRMKEPMFFGSDLEFLNCERLTRDQYDGLFRGAGDGMVIGEASTCYLYSLRAAEEIRAFAPDARIIVMLRDPVTVMHAWHGEAVANGVEPILDFAGALDAERRRRAGRDLPRRRGMRQGLYYRAIVDYATHLERFFDVFGRSHVHVILFDDWVAATAEGWRATLSFLGIDNDFVPNFQVVNPSRQVPQPPCAPARLRAATLGRIGPAPHLARPRAPGRPGHDSPTEHSANAPTAHRARARCCAPGGMHADGGASLGDVGPRPHRLDPRQQR